MTGSKKYSVSLPEELAETVRAHVGPGGFSAYIAEALEQRVAMDKLGEIVKDYAKDHDPLSRAEVEAARALLRHEGGQSREQVRPHEDGNSAGSAA
jgi:Arc/MetJ-type ribon-helix-helix transcriptional regulator